MTRSLTLFWTRRDETRVFSDQGLAPNPTLRSKKIFWKNLLHCIKLHNSGKLQTREDTCSQVNQYIKIIDVKADLKNVLEDWLDGWDHGKASDKAWQKPYLKRIIILFKLNGSNSIIILYFSWMPGQSWCKSPVSKHSRIRLSSPFPVCVSVDFRVQVPEQNIPTNM